MEIIGNQKIWTFPEGAESTTGLSTSAIRKGRAHLVRNYVDLATKVAELQFRNRDFVLMFRGQTGDHKNRLGYTSLKPTLLRAAKSSHVPTETTLNKRFERLVRAEAALVTEYKARGLLGRDRLERQRILRWAMIQHYEICATPLLDVTQSLRIAASFASHNANGEAFVFVLGIPNISGAITASAEAGIQTVRLASVCPPTAVRPHVQEGYLLAEYPECATAEQKLLYSHAEMDFGRRLIAKFRFEPDSFWEKSGHFPLVGESALYPRASVDGMCALAEAVRSSLPS
ncbi:FRG domain-containing protein [Sphingopyxis indica]|uniref:FRG domain-containing protein n=1 Tax=Sphingopyxis indica TaxID=436663 RepID=UPI0029391DA8|nr:FRG domain-containing protein [Sphingopyxis indica]WOF43873.1 FRG domain-containing protein [Sphingopyxis indica]